MTQTFWLEPTDEVLVGLRRYSRGEGYTCETGYHSAITYTGRTEAHFSGEGDRKTRDATPDETPHDDPRWPATCDRCDYAFVEEDQWQPWDLLLYRRTDTNELRVLHQNASVPYDAPSAEPGACWDAWWMPFSRGDDGICLMVRCPGGHDWMVDSRASNCGLPDDKVHKCWIRHGDPRECHVTVDKNGITCNAGAGSIGTPNWHGFLRDGQLVE